MGCSGDCSSLQHPRLSLRRIYSYQGYLKPLTPIGGQPLDPLQPTRAKPIPDPTSEATELNTFRILTKYINDNQP